MALHSIESLRPRDGVELYKDPLDAFSPEQLEALKSETILFANDWLTSTARPDLSTPNRSWVHLARLLKFMGVKNHMFFLALYDQRLKGIDPHDPNLTEEQILWVITECYRNPWYFFREVVRAPARAGGESRPIEANRGNIALFWFFFNHVTTLLIQVRQTGKSFNSDLMAVYLLMIKCRGTQINLLTKDEKLRRVNVQRIKDIMSALPPYLDFRTRKDTYNSESITVVRNGNSYETHLPQASEKLAENAARGLSSEIFFIDEPPFQSNIQIALPTALAAGGAMRDIAMANGSPYCTVMTTTAGKKDTKEGAFMFKLMSEMMEFSDRLYDANDQKDLYNIIIANAKCGEARVNITLNHRQVGKSDDWLKRKIADSIASADRADRDFFNRWTSGTATNPLSIQQLERIRKSEIAPVYEGINRNGGYLTKWYIEEHEIQKVMNSEDIIVVFDTSEASGGDDISMRVSGIRTGQCYATAAINNTNIISFSEWVAGWVVDYPRTTLLIERRSTGSAVIDVLLKILPAKNINPFRRLFNTIVNNPENHKDDYATIQQPMWRWPGDFLDLKKGYFGFSTSGSGMTSRRNLYGQILNSAANTVGHLVYDKKTIDQIASLITKNSRVDHPPGEHDDMVISWILTHWFNTKATNLKFYGIDATSVLSSVKAAVVQTPAQILREKQQATIKAAIKVKVQALKGSKDVSVIERLEHDLRVIYSRLEASEQEKLSFDDLLISIREEKLKNKIMRTGARVSNDVTTVKGGSWAHTRNPSSTHRGLGNMSAFSFF